jgi:predicted ABC-type transport system involved in lysophospholipase L1 biosynthesis ATPase subunit
LQGFNLIPSLNARENVAVPLIATKTMSRPEAFSKADEILDRVELGDKTNHKPSLRCSVNCTLGDELWRCQRATHG